MWRPRWLLIRCSRILPPSVLLGAIPGPYKTACRANIALLFTVPVLLRCSDLTYLACDSVLLSGSCPYNSWRMCVVPALAPVVYCRVLWLSSTQVFQRLSLTCPVDSLSLWSLHGRCRQDSSSHHLHRSPRQSQRRWHHEVLHARPSRHLDFPPACVRLLHHHGEAEIPESCSESELHRDPEKNRTSRARPTYLNAHDVRPWRLPPDRPDVRVSYLQPCAHLARHPRARVHVTWPTYPHACTSPTPLSARASPWPLYYTPP